MMRILEVVGLTKRFAGLTALDDYQRRYGGLGDRLSEALR